MTAQLLPVAAKRYLAFQQRELREALAAVGRLSRGLRADALDVSWRRVRGPVLAVLVAAQSRMVAGTGSYVGSVMSETGQAGAFDTVGEVSSSGLLGVAGDGRSLLSLIDRVPVDAKVRIGGGVSPGVAVRQSVLWLGGVSSTALSDTGRQSELLHMAVRPSVSGFVRMLVPPSCARCVVLAGKRFRFNAGFQRHPMCDCRHIPASEGVAGDLVLDSDAYFGSLSEGEQDKVFTKAGAEAVRAGADVAQVVNVRSGMAVSQPFGRQRGGRRVASGGVRLMPESIVAVAKGDRGELVRLLRVHGYIR